MKVLTHNPCMAVVRIRKRKIDNAMRRLIRVSVALDDASDEVRKSVLSVLYSAKKDTISD